MRLLLDYCYLLGNVENSRLRTAAGRMEAPAFNQKEFILRVNFLHKDLFFCRHRGRPRVDFAAPLAKKFFPTA